jgi:hypothetical protein
VSENRTSKYRISPTGVAKQSPCYKVTSRKRRRFLASWIRKLATPAGRKKIDRELLRLTRISRYWVNKANKFGVEAWRELMLAILDDLDFTTWQTRNNLETLAKRSGLDTHSDAGNKSISRASHASDRLAQMGLIITAKAPFNPYDAKCACKQIEVTESFFAALGIPLKQVYRERAKLLGAEPEEVIDSGDARLIERRFANIMRMAAAGLARMKERRAQARQLKKEYSSPNSPPSMA